MENPNILLTPYRDLLRAIKKALLEKDIAAALKVTTLVETMLTALVDFNEPKEPAETAYEAKVALMEALNKDTYEAADKPESKND